MTDVRQAVDQVLAAQQASGRPLGIVVAGHNGSGKSTLWYERLAAAIQIPLVNADRMMMSILPEPSAGKLPGWAAELRDTDASWMQVAQRGVEAFVLHAMTAGVPFALETVFSDWREQADGTVLSKIDRIREMQQSGYFVVLLFVGLSDAELSVGRVLTRVFKGGHNVDVEKLRTRFPRTQRAIRAALPVADAAILTDNSREPAHAFTLCRIQMGAEEVFDLRAGDDPVPAQISAWLDVIAPREAPAD
ncbi:zeta toxin family protein [Phenylobacterium sp.]|uniref:zeta toxin family protein n=1 Tax=Phenylobacterium sp. TaxID=1871053 RepID=UPI002E34C48D|nr:zeta toxin family protein [Phenylobacterium sp.]HEX3365779.1 zeta toxin family protein [Phenylobacterium sp.]